MASRASQILSAVKAALAAGLTGAGDSGVDLSAAGRVQIGRPSPTDGPALGAWVAPVPVVGEHGPELGRYKRTLRMDIEVRAPASSSGTEARALFALDLVSDVLKALEVDRALGGLVLDVLCAGAGVDGDECGIPGMCVALVEMEVYWHTSTGA